MLLSVLDVVTKERNFLLPLALLAGVVVVALANIQESATQDTIEQLPFCGDESERTISRRLLYVTTLDGKLTALDILKSGKKHWSISTGPGPLVSSSIHKLELTNNGQFVRMIPSLSGGIYKFDGHSVDPIPISADNLLSSSFKFSDDLVIAGGKETRSYGVSSRTGQVLYECSMQGCMNHTDSINKEEHVQSQADGNGLYQDHDPLLDDVVVIRRQTQTVRAVEPRTGNERWNFSVGHHELELIKSQECHETEVSELDIAMMDLEVKVVIPEGIICALSKSNPGTILWKYKFDHPIVSAWQIDKDAIKSIDLFTAQWFWDPIQRHTFEHDGLVAPSIYLGMYQKQLYIQESARMQKLITDQTHEFTHNMILTDTTMPSIPWKPIPATSSALSIIANDKIYDERDRVILEEGEEDDKDEDTSVTAISVLYASEYVNGNGFYLYSAADLDNKDNSLCDSSNSSEHNGQDFLFDFDDDDTPAKIIIISLWFWWKEILVISLTSAIVLNLLLSPKIRRERQVVVIERHIAVPTAVEATEESVSKSNGSQRSLSESNSSYGDNFTSRFQTDFDLVRCLGKGGFGVVFEAKNKLDDCNYAVKRITLPNKKESRERVMREVKTLANCEHQNIVRYFQAWVENPPPGWQETEDEKWIQNDVPSTSIQIETPDGTTLPSMPTKSDWSKSDKMQSWLSGAKIDDCVFEDDDDDDSFIEFRSETKDDDDNVAINIHSKHNGITTTADANNLEESDQSDSFEIEFKEQTKENNATSTGDDHCDEDSTPKNVLSRRSHKRPLSLDLSSNGHVIVPIPPKKLQNKVYLYIQMQLCKKHSLRDWLRSNKLEMRQAHIKGIFQQIVDAVDYVHVKGLIHRDLKPGNIFFSLDGQVKIGDFGLVTDMSDRPTVDTLSNGKTDLPSCARRTQQVGTHLYMSPEQLQGCPYDFKVDIFSLGLIFFELLVYFETEMERIVTLRGLRDGKFPSDFTKTFPKEFSLLKLMLSKSPAERPPTFQIKEDIKLITPWLV